MREFVALASTKRGLAQALHSGDPAFDFMPAKRDQRLFPAFRKLFNAALSAGEIRGDVGADGVLNAAATLCMAADPARYDQSLGLVMLMVNGLRCRLEEKPNEAQPGRRAARPNVSRQRPGAAVETGRAERLLLEFATERRCRKRLAERSESVGRQQRRRCR